MPLFAGPFPYVTPTDKVGAYPQLSERLARTLAVPDPVEILSSGPGSSNTTSGWVNMPGVPRAYLDATPPSVAPAGTGVLCILHASALVKQTSGSGQFRIGIGILNDQPADGEPDANSVPSYTHNGVMNPTGTFSSIATDFHFVLKRRASLRIKIIVGGGTVDVGHGRLSITPLRYIVA